AFVARIPEGTTVLSGGARGVDRAAAAAARARGLAVEEFLPDWRRHGRVAGLRRNQALVDAADSVVAFHDLLSRGTAHAIACARAKQKPLCVYGPEGEEVDRWP